MDRKTMELSVRVMEEALVEAEKTHQTLLAIGIEEGVARLYGPTPEASLYVKSMNRLFGLLNNRDITTKGQLEVEIYIANHELVTDINSAEARMRVYAAKLVSDLFAFGPGEYDELVQRAQTDGRTSAYMKGMDNDED